MQCILYKIYFWKVFHMYYNLICILYALLCGHKFYSCKKWVLQCLKYLRAKDNHLSNVKHSKLIDSV
jgi:hypothetical protein